jgi:hypothetical protein
MLVDRGVVGPAVLATPQVEHEGSYENQDEGSDDEDEDG